MALELKPSTGFTIDVLKKQSDEQLLDTLGYVNKLDEFKKSIAEADKLSGKARQDVEKELNEMLSPRIYPGDLQYAIDKAKRKADPKAALNDASPASALDYD